MRLAIGIPTRGAVTCLTLESIDAAIESCGAMLDARPKVCYERGDNYCDPKNNLANWFMAGYADALLLLDDDQGIPPGALAAMIQSTADIVTCPAINMKRQQLNHEWRGGELIYFATACAFIRRSAFEHMAAPWWRGMKGALGKSDQAGDGWFSGAALTSGLSVEVLALPSPHYMTTHLFGVPEPCRVFYKGTLGANRYETLLPTDAMMQQIAGRRAA